MIFVCRIIVFRLFLRFEMFKISVSENLRMGRTFLGMPVLHPVCRIVSNDHKVTAPIKEVDFEVHGPGDSNVAQANLGGLLLFIDSVFEKNNVKITSMYPPRPLEAAEWKTSSTRPSMYTKVGLEFILTNTGDHNDRKTEEVVVYSYTAANIKKLYDFIQLAAKERKTPGFHAPYMLSSSPAMRLVVPGSAQPIVRDGRKLT